MCRAISTAEEPGGNGDGPTGFVRISDRNTLALSRSKLFNVGQMCHLFGQAIRSGQPCDPDFDTAVSFYRLIDTVQAASAQGCELAVPAA